MSAGTLTLANNSNVVAGIDTSFTTDLSAGDFIVITTGGVTYTLPVKTIESDIALTLARNYNGPTVTAGAWTAMPRDTLNRISAQIAADTAYIVRQRVLEVDNWYQLLEVDGNVTIVMNDGSTYTGPSWKYIADNMATKTGGAVPIAQGGTGSTTAAGARKNLGLDNVATTTDGAVPVSQGGTGATTAAAARTKLGLENVAMKTDGAVAISEGGTGSTTASGARKNLGLGSSATRNAFSDSGDMLSVGDFGVGAVYSSGSGMSSQGQATVTGFYGSTSDGYSDLGVAGDFSTLVMNRGNRPTRINQSYNLKRTWFSYYSGSAWTYHEAYTTGNTTKTSDGTLKAASPIVKIYSDGLSETNEESQGCTVTRLALGEYLIEGCTGMNSDASWGGIDGGFDIPLDRNKQPLIWLDYEVNADGSVLVKTYHRTHPEALEFARNLIGTKDDAGVFTETVQNGDPIDIPEDVFISVRVEMPADSAYNLSLLESRAEQQSSSEPDDEPVV